MIDVPDGPVVADDVQQGKINSSFNQTLGQFFRNQSGMNQNLQPQF